MCMLKTCYKCMSTHLNANANVSLDSYANANANVISRNAFECKYFGYAFANKSELILTVLALY